MSTLLLTPPEVKSSPCPARKDVKSLTPKEAKQEAAIVAEWLLKSGDSAPRFIESAARNYLGQLLNKTYGYRGGCRSVRFLETYPERILNRPMYSLAFEPNADCVRL